MKEEEKGKNKFQFSSNFDRVEIEDKKSKVEDDSTTGWVWKDDQTPRDEDVPNEWVWIDTTADLKPVSKKKKKKNSTKKEENKVEESSLEVEQKPVEEKPKKKTTTRKKSTTTKKSSTSKKTGTRKSSTTKKTTTKKTTLREKKDIVLPEYEFVPDSEDEKKGIEEEVAPTVEEPVCEVTRDETIAVSDIKNDTIVNKLVEATVPVEDAPKEEVSKVHDEIVEEVMAAMEKREIEDETAVLNRSESDVAMENPKFKKLYVNFQTRVILLVLGILILFGSACFIIVSTLQSNEIQKVGYVENSTVHYDVCSTSNSPYDTNCLKEGNTYASSNVSKIHVDFSYEALFENPFNYNMSYYIVITNRIFDQNDNNKVSYEDEDVVVRKTEIPVDNPGKVNSSIEVDYQKYNRFVQEYKRKYSSSVDAMLDVSLFIDDSTQTRSVAKLQIPLGLDSFQVTKEISIDEEQEYVSRVNDWSNTSTLYIVIGSVFVILSLFLLFHLTKLSLAVTGKKSKYQEELDNLLTEYDRLIVIARDGYESNVEKQVIKVDNFDELLDAREVLQKPIIYSKINNVKSEFIVEDEFIIYKFILKEADVEQQQQ